MFIQPYLFFNGRCEEAISFYGKALDAKVTMMMRNNESPEPHQPGMLPPGSENKIMHANLQIRDVQIMASDGHCQGTAKFEGIGLTLNATDKADATKLFASLVEGGQAQMPLTETFFADSFGMVTDKFGVLWMIMAAKKP